MKKYEKPFLLSLYKKMAQIRKFEEKLFYLFSTRQMPGTMHQCNGQEASAVGVCMSLNADDYITSTHRGHGHCIAKGAKINEVMAEMFAKSTGCCKGMGGSLHIADFSVGMLGANGIVAGGIPQAVGAAWASSYFKTGKVAVAFFGDGAVNEGAFHEAVNLASVWNLPVVFVCENNMYGLSTHYSKTVPFKDIADRAKGYNIAGEVVDGMDVLKVYEAAQKAVKKARRGKGPTLLECKTYRYMGHSRFEKPTYRTKQEVDEWKKKDPLLVLAAKLKAEYGINQEEMDTILSEVDSEMDAAVAFAEASPDPNPQDYLQYVFSK